MMDHLIISHIFALTILLMCTKTQLNNGFFYLYENMSINLSTAYCFVFMILIIVFIVDYICT